VVLLLLAACEGERTLPERPDAGPGASAVWTGCVVEGMGAPAALPEKGTTESALPVPAPPDTAADLVTSVLVRVSLTHAYPRDLSLELVSPAGTVVPLAADHTGYDGVVFRDDAPPPPAVGALTGPSRPTGPLGRLQGEPVTGSWTLRIIDDTEGDAGSLAAWGLTIATCVADAPSCTGGVVLVESRMDNPLENIPPVQRALAVTGVGDATILAVRTWVSLDHDVAEDVDLSLYSPAGTKVELSTDNGSVGDDYDDTWFYDGADLSITDGYAPFEGVFRPEQPLSTVAGEPAAGTWVLEILDDTPSMETGMLRAVQLELDVCELLCPSGAQAVRATAGPAEIPAGGAVTLDLPVALAGDTVVVAARVSAEFEGGAVAVTLAAPGGTAVLLGTSQFVMTYFTDGAAVSVEEGDVPHTDHVRPVQPLGPLVGGAAAGTWTLTAQVGSGDTPGQLALAELYLCVAP
jgi:subtilisin-like proprotein convertase family protein